MSFIPNVNVPSSISGTGTGKADNGLFTNHVFSAGLEKPNILKSLLVKFPQFYMLDVYEKLGLSKKITLDGSGKYTWTKMGRTRKGSVLGTVTNGTTTSATVVTDIAYTSANAAGYWLPGDTFYVVNSGARGVVTAVGDSGGFQTITAAKADGSAWSTATILAGFKIGHTGSSYGQGSSGSGGFRSYFPDSDYNVSTIARRGIKITRNLLQEKTILDDGSWFYNHEDFEQKEFAKDIDAGMFFGSRYASTTFGGRSQSRGLLEYAEEEGQEVTYSSAVGVQEADLKLLIESLIPQGGSKNILLATGLKQHSDLQSALGNNYRPIPNSIFQQKTGIDVETYHFFGKDITLMNLEMFHDDSIVPQVAASSTAKDFRNFGIALDLGDVGGGRTNIEVGYVQEVTQKAITGMASDSFEVSNAFDGAQFELLAEYMPVCYFPNRLGLLYASS